MSAPENFVALAFGANLGDAQGNIRRAVAFLAARGVDFERVSSLYATKPWGVEDQPDFVNACAVARTALAPRALLALTQEAERALGRTPGLRWGPRVIDIDILLYEDVVWADENLVLPHPEMTRRAFVLQPLAEIAPDLRVNDATVYQLAQKFRSEDVQRLTAF
ncbi:2-amino-4-hydroxy-6-hydroxymethyldihydropteridine diphosphokinase [Rhodoblastus acidophilus]|uniref:2-amino-4-hydroxy-6- hydroxymethyldihydropteridine diphosphokinase n=1 Tax=Rhodoblastus acidophilus TaxID=1074 RepID=UPI0022259762|nr:2-amino-4-hydroxy-6-hydroxymethyldihydropteridine diphosphokinase [Rhodoblastus acidophilus]MCW2283318.1 2-amino-4-hydroxy-6-hydroxymethyldihydropteridine diphosphokinase [Rhodoblastus acidophilus]MCW2332178.1 2-amino-4-hydroxy-6-hydroxymethyldihydropteridine diphosphokinase [Rhodoblastus acidophilus]